MHSFYILLAGSIIAGTLIGYLAGFARLLFFTIKISVAALGAFVLTPVVANFISTSNLVSDEYSRACTFIFLLLIFFSFLQLLFFLFPKHINKLHDNIINKIAGAATSLALSFILVIAVAQFTTLLNLPPEAQEPVHASGVDSILNTTADLLNEKFAPLIEKQPVQVMAMETVDPTNEEGIVLPFTVNDFETSSSLEADMLLLVNEERRKHKLHPLIADAQLTAAARMHSADMFKRGYFSHNTPEGVNPFQRLHKLHISYLYAGENLAMAPTLMKAHIGLMKSPGHRANILNPSFRKAGIGILDSGTRGLMITQEFKD